MKNIIITVLAIPFLAGCAAAGLMYADISGPAHTHFDYETGSYFCDDGYHWETQTDGKQLAVKDADYDKQMALKAEQKEIERKAALERMQNNLHQDLGEMRWSEAQHQMIWVPIPQKPIVPKR